MSADAQGDSKMEAGKHEGQDAAGQETGRPKASRRPRAKPPEAAAAVKRSLNLRVDVETYERLTVHAMKRHLNISDLVMEYARLHLREYSVHRNGQRSGESGPIGVVSEAG